MLERKISIDREKCDGCGLCVTACHEGAIELVDGKAALVRENACDGLGDCLPACPRGAISFSDPEPTDLTVRRSMVNSDPSACLMADPGYQWPIQIALVPARSDFFRGTLVIGADCAAFVVDDFRRRMIGSSPVIIGCPKLDERSRFDKLKAILSENPVDEVRVVRMEVPCCSALTRIVREAAESCGRDVRVIETVVSRSGSILR